MTSKKSNAFEYSQEDINIINIAIKNFFVSIEPDFYDFLKNYDVPIYKETLIVLFANAVKKTKFGDIPQIQIIDNSEEPYN